MRCLNQMGGIMASATDVGKSQLIMRKKGYSYIDLVACAVITVRRVFTYKKCVH